MKKKALVLCICIFFANVGLTQSKTAKKKSGTGGVTKELIQRSLDAWSTMDPDKIAPYYSKAPDNIFFDIAPMEYRGWAEWAKGVHNLFADYKIFKLTLADEPAIHNLGNWAWSTELFHVDAVRMACA